MLRQVAGKAGIAIPESFGTGNKEDADKTALVLQAMGELRTRAVKLMQSHIAALPDGRYSFSDILDNDGVIQDLALIGKESDSLFDA